MNIISKAGATDIVFVLAYRIHTNAPERIADQNAIYANARGIATCWQGY